MHLARLFAWRSLRDRPLRTLLSVAGIALGVAGLLAIGIANATAMDAVERLFRDTAGRADLVIVRADGGQSGLPAGALERARAVAGVNLAVPSVQLRTVLADKVADSGVGVNIFGASTAGLTLFGIDPALDERVRGYRLTAGEFLSGDLEAYQLVLTENYAKEQGLRLGSSVAIWTPSGPQRLRLVGLIAREAAGQTSNGAFGVVPLRLAQRLFERQERPDQLDLLADPQWASPARLEELRLAVQARLGADLSVTYPAAQGRRMVQMLGSYQIGLNLMGSMALFVGAFLIYNAFSMSVAERTRELGFLRTVGMTRRQITAQVLVEALLLGLVGAALGVLLGLVMALGLTALMATLLGQEIARPHVPADLLATAAALGVVVTGLGAALPAWQASRISPLAALRARSQQNEGWLVRRGWQPGAALFGGAAFVLVANPFPADPQYRLGSIAVLALFLGGTLLVPATIDTWERLARPVLRRLYGVAGRLGSSNIRRARWRTTLTVAALMVGVALIVVTRGMTDSFKGDLERWIASYLGGDIYVTSSVPMNPELANRLASVEGVAAVAPLHYQQVRWLRAGGVEEEIALMATDPAAYSRVTRYLFADSEQSADAALAALTGGDSVLVSTVLADKHGLRPGNSITLKTARGPHDFRVAGVVVDYYNQGLVVQGTWTDLRRYFAVHEASAFLVKVQPGRSVPEVRQRLDQAYGRREHLTVESNESLLGRILALMTQATALFDVMALISLCVAALGVANTLSMNVAERTQEIGLLRSVGLTRRQAVLMVLAEAGALGLAGGLLGGALGLLLSRAFLTAMTAMSGYRLVWVPPWQAVLLALGVAWLVSQLAALLPARRAARTRILEAIHYE